MTNNLMNYVLLAEVMMATKDEENQEKLSWEDDWGYKAFFVYIILFGIFQFVRFLITRGVK